MLKPDPIHQQFVQALQHEPVSCAKPGCPGPVEIRDLSQLHDRVKTFQLKCEKCGFETAMPNHCNRPMHSDRVGSETKLVCWMGPECGVADIPKHCDAPMHETA